jgi:hypothetical protein
VIRAYAIATISIADEDLDRVRRDPRFTEMMRKYFAA